jgi:hypothetical protein
MTEYSDSMRRECSHYPTVGDKYRVYGATITVTYAQHGTVVLNRGGKFEIQFSPYQFWRWVDEKGALKINA